MAESPRPDETEISHLCQIPQAHTESSFLVSIRELIDQRLMHNEREQAKKSELADLQNQLRLSNQERDELVKKHEAELSEYKKTVLQLLQEKEDWHLQLRECKIQLLKEKEENFKIYDMMKYVAEEDLALKHREITDLQDRHRSETEKLKEEMAKLKMASEDLESRLNEASIQLTRTEELLKKKRDPVDRRQQWTLLDAILGRRRGSHDTQTAQKKKLKTELARSQDLRAQLTTLQESNRLLMEDQALLEEICLTLKRKTLGIFGRRMEERDQELQKMKRKMRESQRQAQAQAATGTQAQAPTGTQAGTGRRPGLTA